MYLETSGYQSVDLVGKDSIARYLHDVVAFSEDDVRHCFDEGQFGTVLSPSPEDAEWIPTLVEVCNSGDVRGDCDLRRLVEAKHARQFVVAAVRLVNSVNGDSIEIFDVDEVVGA